MHNNVPRGTFISNNIFDNIYKHFATKYNDNIFMTKESITKIRNKIDLADKGILDALAYRFALITIIAKFKKVDEIYDANRENSIIF